MIKNLSDNKKKHAFDGVLFFMQMVKSLMFVKDLWPSNLIFVRDF